MTKQLLKRKNILAIFANDNSHNSNGDSKNCNGDFYNRNCVSNFEIYTWFEAIKTEFSKKDFRKRKPFFFTAKLFYITMDGNYRSLPCQAIQVLQYRLR